VGEWASSFPPDTARREAARALIAQVIGVYVRSIEKREGKPFARTKAPSTVRLDGPAKALASHVAEMVADMPASHAAFEVGALYTCALPARFRSEYGIYYTPPALSARLLDMAERAGVDWRTVRVVDPACGGGAFLAPVAERIAAAIDDCPPPLILQNIAGRLRGFEIDPFAAWMSQAFLEITLREVSRSAGRAFPQLVRVCDSLDERSPVDGFDLVIGNPPFGKVRLTDVQRSKYKRSLYGHANLYGVFLDLAVRWTKPGGVIAYVTPTSFLAGEYFKQLRRLLLEEAPPRAIDVVADRKGVFDDVLQETALSTFVRAGKVQKIDIRQVRPCSREQVEIVELGAIHPPKESHAPWFLPRSEADTGLVKKLAGKRTRLQDWGYAVSTGPLVWNRHKSQLSVRRGTGALPLIWAEAVTADGRFIHRAEKRNHAPYFDIREGDDWLLVHAPCVLLQRTTAKEQHRRLIAAELPAAFLQQYGAAVIENHLNMVRPLNDEPKVSPAAVAAVLNSPIVDRAFRCISGSVAVSAFELEALPLPTVKQMKIIERLIAGGAGRETVNAALARIYGEAAA
jgi:adenine-specific DNA-methyltransferase